MISKHAAFAAFAALVASGPAHAAVTISTAATQNMNCAGGTCMPTATDATLNVFDLENLLASDSITIVTTNGSVQANNIDVNAPFSWSAVSALTLDAYQSITFSAAVQDRSTGAVSLVTNDGGSGGALAFFNKGKLGFSNVSNVLSINGQNYQLTASVQDLAVAILSKPHGHIALARDYDASKDGLYYTSPISTVFFGAFNGLGHTISNLKVADGSGQFVGLFANVGYKGSLASIGLTDVLIGGGDSYVGALVGDNSGTITNAFVTGKVTGSDAGGLVGYNSGTITTSKSAARVRAVGNAYAGGIVSENLGTVSLSFATGKISGNSGILVGGLIAVGTGTVSNSYAMGAVECRHVAHYVCFDGGLVGLNNGSTTTSYSTGAVSGERKDSVGGFDGTDQVTITNCYWDTDTSGTTKGSGDGNETGLTGLTTQQLQSGLPAGFDPAIWAEDANVNNGLPYLIANPPK